MNEVELQLTNMEYLLARKDRLKEGDVEITPELKARFIKNIKELEVPYGTQTIRKVSILTQLEEL